LPPSEDLRRLEAAYAEHLFPIEYTFPLCDDNGGEKMAERIHDRIHLAARMRFAEAFQMENCIRNHAALSRSLLAVKRGNHALETESAG
jgi:hypothetical protein